MSAPNKTWIFITDSLQMGGSQRAFIEIASHLHRRLPEVRMHLILLLKDGPLLDEVPPGVELTILESGPGIVFRNIRRVLHLVKIMRREQPEFVVSFLNYVNILVLFCGFFVRGPKIVAVEQCALTVNHATGERQTIPGIARLFLRGLYQRASHVIAISEGLRHELQGMLGLGPDRLQTIHNPISFDKISKRLFTPSEKGFSFAFLGRFVPQKNIPLLLEAFSKLTQRLPEEPLYLTLIGGGHLKESLQQLAKDKGIAEKIRWPGLLKEPWNTLLDCECLVLSSNFEGFANVLAEGLAVGLPIIATDCDYGPRDIIGEHTWLGTLVPTGDVEALTNAMEQAYRHRQESLSYREKRSSYAQKFSTEAIGESYRALLNS